MIWKITSNLLVCSSLLLLAVQCSQGPKPELDPSSTDVSATDLAVQDSTRYRLDTLSSEYMSSSRRLENRIKIIEDRTTFADSMYFELREDVQKLKDQVYQLNTSQPATGSAAPSTVPVPSGKSLSYEAYHEAYVDALGDYQNGRYDQAKEKFRNLLSIETSYDISDNCQYWMGEIYYAKKDYRQAMTEFEKVFLFSGTNKADHALFKLGLCSLNIGDNTEARNYFERHIQTYPDSELNQRAKQYLEQL